jgi:hypothetical protein
LRARFADRHSWAYTGYEPRERVVWENNRLAMDELIELGVELRRTPQDILDESLEAWHQILEEEYEVNPAFRRIANSQLEWAAKAVVSKRILEPDYEPLADIYWGPGGFVEGADFLEFEYQTPPYYQTFTDPVPED